MRLLPTTDPDNSVLNASAEAVDQASRVLHDSEEVASRSQETLDNAQQSIRSVNESLLRTEVTLFFCELILKDAVEAWESAFAKLQRRRLSNR